MDTQQLEMIEHGIDVVLYIKEGRENLSIEIENTFILKTEPTLVGILCPCG